MCFVVIMGNCGLMIMWFEEFGLLVMVNVCVGFVMLLLWLVMGWLFFVLFDEFCVWKFVEEEFVLVLVELCV